MTQTTWGDRFWELTKRQQIADYSLYLFYTTMGSTIYIPPPPPVNDWTILGSWIQTDRLCFIAEPVTVQEEEYLIWTSPHPCPQNFIEQTYIFVPSYCWNEMLTENAESYGWEVLETRNSVDQRLRSRREGSHQNHAALTKPWRKLYVQEQVKQLFYEVLQHSATRPREYSSRMEEGSEERWKMKQVLQNARLIKKMKGFSNVT